MTEYRQKICIVTLELAEAVGDGEFGIAMSALAEALAEAGAEVCILYPSVHAGTGSITEWILDYQSRGIELVSLYLDMPSPQMSHAVYSWLKRRHFDVVHFHDMRGVGYWTVVAKNAGLAFGKTRLVCHLQSQTMWQLAASAEFLSDISQLELEFLERRSAELADIVISPSRYMIEDVQSRGWSLPAEHVILPNLQPKSWEGVPARASGGRLPVRELVFFGRLETRKGLETICRALSQLAARGVAPAMATFLGKEGLAGSRPAFIYIDRASRDWNFPFQILNDFNFPAALEYLRADGRLAVIAYTAANSPNSVLACLAHGIPFVASNVGGIAELIDAADHSDVQFDQDAGRLAEVLERVLQHGAVTADLALDPAKTRNTWLDWHRGLSTVQRPLIEMADGPLVSVCISHFSRPRLLDQAIRSIEAQTYERIELIVVDDASPDQETQVYLAGLTSRFKARGWMLARNERELWAGASRNRAVSLAKGEFILLMDDDNVARPEEVETMLRAALATKADIVTCQQQVFEGDNCPPPLERLDYIGGWMPIGPNIAQAFFTNCLGDLNMLVRRSAWQVIGGFTDDRAGAEDYEFLLEAVLAGFSLVCLPEALYWYRVSGKQLAKRLDDPTLYRSFMRPLRPFFKRVPKEMQLALQLASNRNYHELKRNRQSYWADGSSRGQSQAENAVALNAAASLLAMARAAQIGGRLETARGLQRQAARLGARHAVGDRDTA